MTQTTQRVGNPALYRAVWRWHFYAGLIVLPFMILLAVTGGIYLFKDEINDVAYAQLRLVEPAQTPMLAPSTLSEAALTAYPGTLKSYTPPSAPDRSALVKIANAEGVKDTIYVNPYTAQVLGSFWDVGPSGSPVMYVVRKMHSLEYIGWWGNRIIEAVAGWLVLLVGTGIYLWWPRGKAVGVSRITATKGRPWWRDVHAVTGIYTAFFIVFLAMTGLPWSSVWGGKFYDLSYAAGIGMPDGYWSKYPTSTELTGDALDRTPWILEKQPMPLSEPLSEAASAVPAGINQVVAIVEGLGIAPGYALNMPSGAQGVFTASVYPDDITQERVIHLDQYTGEVLYDAGLNDLGGLGWAAEWGISIHMGQAWGLPNQIVLLLACAAMVLMAVSAVVMWWKRRPAKTLGAPQLPADWRMPRTVLLMALAAGIFFPLVGASLIVIAVIELARYALRRRSLPA